MRKTRAVGISDKRFLWIAVLVYTLFLSWAWTFIVRSHEDVTIFRETAGKENSFNATDARQTGIHGTLSMFAVTTSDIRTGADEANLEELSSVDYYACCGLGHRLIRMTLAAYVARQNNFTLRNFWGWCGEQQPVEVFSYLFRPVPAEEVAHFTSRNMVIPFYNEVPGFPALVRKATSTMDGNGHPNNLQQQQQQQQLQSRQVRQDENPHQQQPTADPGSCVLCPADKVQSDLDLYSSLRDRFRHKQLVDDFVQTHFENATVIGIHVRAGNNEGGDFDQKGRGISNPDLWVKDIRDLVESQLLGGKHKSGNDETDDKSFLLSKPPIIYLATDTPSMVRRFRHQFATINIPVVDLPQQGRPQEGMGVLFGESDKVHNKGDVVKQSGTDDRRHHDDHENKSNGDGVGGDDYSSCLKGWSDTVADMLLLSHADVVIAGKPSSFVQTLPMSLAFGKPMADRKLTLKNKVYCEVIPRYRQVSSVLNGTSVNGDVDEWEETSPTMQCYGSYADWCCNYSTWIKFHYKGPKGHDKVIAKEFVRFQPTFPAGLPSMKDHHKVMRNRTANCLRPRRGREGGGWRDKCLPHSWV